VKGIILNKNVKRTAIVTHGGVIRSLLTKLGQEEREFWDWKISHGTGFQLVWKNKEAFRRGERCTLLREALLTENPLG
jgi:alpha-ribazole phosphatase